MHSQSFSHNKIWEISVKSIKETKKGKIGHLRGRYFELIYYSYLSEVYKDKYESLYSNLILNSNLNERKEIDILGETINEIHIFQCKLRISKKR